MNWIDIFGWAIVTAGVVGLWIEIPIAVREIRKILAESKALQAHVKQGGNRCKTREHWALRLLFSSLLGMR